MKMTIFLIGALLSSNLCHARISIGPVFINRYNDTDDEIPEAFTYKHMVTSVSLVSENSNTIQLAYTSYDDTLWGRNGQRYPLNFRSSGYYQIICSNHSQALSIKKTLLQYALSTTMVGHITPKDVMQDPSENNLEDVMFTIFDGNANSGIYNLSKYPNK